MTDIVWKTFNTIFYWLSLFAAVYFITQVNWKDASSIEVLRDCGSIGGLLFIGEFFRKESKEGSDKLSSVKGDVE